MRPPPVAVQGWPTALSWVIAALIALVLVVLMFKLAARVLHRMIGLITSILFTTAIRAQLSPWLQTWLNR